MVYIEESICQNIYIYIYIKDGTYVINVGTHWSALFGFPEEIKEFVGNKNIIANIF